LEGEVQKTEGKELWDSEKATVAVSMSRERRGSRKALSNKRKIERGPEKERERNKRKARRWANQNYTLPGQRGGGGNRKTAQVGQKKLQTKIISY